ncbi:hypothetical protein HPB51_023331 [Rhipicephalus microplus]|uniref:Uncharacterized protein n=1 Tax=Rhipicephalus microplus TaxID=6941 RepID=A0A9J6EQ78_RHIMP|nr:hypothetical protein HPB51_023331 [Rhipicephalus microplus]
MLFSSSKEKALCTMTLLRGHLLPGTADPRYGIEWGPAPPLLIREGVRGAEGDSRDCTYCSLVRIRDWQQGHAKQVTAQEQTDGMVGLAMRKQPYANSFGSPNLAGAAVDFDARIGACTKNQTSEFGVSATSPASPDTSRLRVQTVASRDIDRRVIEKRQASKLVGVQACQARKT